MELLKSRLHDFLNKHGKEWVNQFRGDSTGNRKVTCPEGFVKVPIDSWHCKFDDGLCNLQACIDLSDKNNFLTYCRAKRKENIYKAVEQQVYTGFHHIPGRFLCPSCDHFKKDSQQNFKYHYPWELYPLWECVQFDTPMVNIQLDRKDIPLSVKYCKVCAPCFLKTVSILSPQKALDFIVIEVDFFPR